MGGYRVFTNRQTAEAARAFEQGKKIVFKLHGDVSHQESIVLTSQDYDRIIFGTADVRNLLRSILSTKTVLFLGFSLTDPHLDLLLRSIREANSGMPVTHYALLPMTSRLRMDSLESKYGIRLLSYILSDRSHPELKEFLGKLATAKNPPAPASPGAATAQEACRLIAARLKELLGLTQISILWEETSKTIVLGVVSRSGTELELQNEIVSIAKQFYNLETLVDRVRIYMHGSSNKFPEIDLMYPLVLCYEFTTTDALAVSSNRSSPKEFWSKISISSVTMPSSVQKVVTAVAPPFIGAD